VEPHWIVAVVLALLAGGAAAWFGVPGTIYRALREQLQHEQAARKAADAEVERLRVLVAAAERELPVLREQAKRLQRAGRMLARVNGLGDALDQAQDGIVFSSSERGGTWVWVNRAMCDALGYERDELLRVGWRPLVHPADVDRTRQVEEGAWDGAVSGYVVRYRRHPSIGGGWVRLRWTCPAYWEGMTVCVVIFGQVIEETKE
jgi:PAS domain S-box-containing protein